MKIPVIINDDIHKAALREARRLGKENGLSVGMLNAPLDEEATGWVDQIWDTIEIAINNAYHEGINAARPFIDKVYSMLTDLTTSFAKRAEEIRTVINERLNSYLINAIDGALRRVRSSLSVGAQELKLKSVSVEQRIKMSGSLKASLAEVCEFVAEGELSLSAEYNAAP